MLLCLIKRAICVNGLLFVPLLSHIILFIFGCAGSLLLHGRSLGGSGGHSVVVVCGLLLLWVPGSRA